MRISRFLWGSVALSWLLVGAAMVRNGWTIGGGWSIIATTVGFGAACMYCHSTPGTLTRRLLDTIENHVLLSLVAMLGAVASYLIAASSTGYHDAGLAGWDAMTGLSWKSWYDIVDGNSILQFGSRAIYLGVFFLYPTVIISILCFNRIDP